MPHIFFPQWQGSHGRSDLAASAASLRQIIEELAMPNHVQWVAIPLIETAQQRQEQGILSRSDLLQQLGSASQIIRALHPERLAVLGGDCGIEVAAIPALHDRYGASFGVLWVDAHADLNTPASSPSATFHGMPLRVLLGEGDAAFTALAAPALAPGQVALVGVRDLDEPERRFIQQRGIASSMWEDLRQRPACAAEGLIERGCKHIYVLLDMDALDPAEFPFSAMPTPGGLPMMAIVPILEYLTQQDALVGLCLTEYASRTGEGAEQLAPILAHFLRLG